MGKNITVLGAGAWGTAFGQVLADAGNTVTMWAKEQQIVEAFAITTTTPCACRPSKSCRTT